MREAVPEEMYDNEDEDTANLLNVAKYLHQSTSRNIPEDLNINPLVLELDI